MFDHNSIVLLFNLLGGTLCLSLSKDFEGVYCGGDLTASSCSQCPIDPGQLDLAAGQCGGDCSWLNDTCRFSEAAREGLPEIFTISSTGLSSSVMPSLLGRYTFRSISHLTQGDDVICWHMEEEDNFLFYYQNNSRSNVIGVSNNITLIMHGPENKDLPATSGWEIEVNGTWVEDPQLKVVPMGVDCQWASWTISEPCNTSCGGGIQRLARRKITRATKYGMECQGSSGESVECGMNDCDTKSTTLLLALCITLTVVLVPIFAYWGRILLAWRKARDMRRESQVEYTNRLILD